MFPVEFNIKWTKGPIALLNESKKGKKYIE